MGTDMWAKVVQRGILLRDRGDRREALLMQNPDGTWELPGGKIEHGDTAAESLEREVEEETGLTVMDATPVETAVRKVKKRKKRGKFGVVYRCAFEAREVELSDEHVDFAWVTYDEVGRMNVKAVDEYRSLRRVLQTTQEPEESDSASPTTTAEGGGSES